MSPRSTRRVVDGRIVIVRRFVSRLFCLPGPAGSRRGSGGGAGEDLLSVFDTQRFESLLEKGRIGRREREFDPPPDR